MAPWAGMCTVALAEDHCEEDLSGSDTGSGSLSLRSPQPPLSPRHPQHCTCSLDALRGPHGASLAQSPQTLRSDPCRKCWLWEWTGGQAPRLLPSVPPSSVTHVPTLSPNSKCPLCCLTPLTVPRAPQHADSASHAAAPTREVPQIWGSGGSRGRGSGWTGRPGVLCH